MNANAFLEFSECCAVKIYNIKLVSNLDCKQQNKNISRLDFYEPLL